MRTSALGRLILLGTALVSTSAVARSVNLDVQMGSYLGEEAFFAAYLVDAKGRYVRTLWVSGKDRTYYKDMSRWWRYLGRQPQDLDAITGASTGSGDEAALTVEIDEAELNAGFELRIESAVEDLSVFPEDVALPLGDDSVGKEVKGTGFIRFVTLNY